MLEGLPDVVRHYFELDPRDIDGFVALFSDEATVVLGRRSPDSRGEAHPRITNATIRFAAQEFF
jgi:hypothetical protein